MFAVIRKSDFYLESLENATLYYNIEWSFDSVRSDKMGLVRKTVMKDAGLLE